MKKRRSKAALLACAALIAAGCVCAVAIAQPAGEESGKPAVQAAQVEDEGVQEVRGANGAKGSEQEESRPWEPAWGAGMNCEACHEDIELDKPKFMVTAHFEAGLACVDCHNSEVLGEFHTQAFSAPAEDADEADGDKKADEADPKDAEAAEEPIKVAYDAEFCLGCHIEGNPHPSWEALAELTADSEVALSIEDKTPINPHAPHPEGTTAEELTCAMCHTAHGRSAGVSGCYGCHHSYTLQSCDDCHKLSA